jgi:fumarate hydratase, class I
MAPEFTYQDLLPIGEDKTEYRLLSSEGISTFTAEGREFLKVSGDAISNLTQVAIHDISHYLRAEHLQQLANILTDPESSPNDRFVAIDLLKNANISAGGILPMCQDTGTAIVMGKKGQQVLTEEKDEISISKGVLMHLLN